MDNISSSDDEYFLENDVNMNMFRGTTMPPHPLGDTDYSSDDNNANKPEKSEMKKTKVVMKMQKTWVRKYISLISNDSHT